MDCEQHRRSMVERFLWLESIDPAYAKKQLQEYVKDPASPNPDMVALVQAEWWRRNCGPLQPRSPDPSP